MISGKSENKGIGDDKYLQSLLYSYQQHKKQIVINLDSLYQSQKKRIGVKEEMLRLILYDGLNLYDTDKDTCNIIKVHYLSSIFTELQRVILYTTDLFGTEQYKCNHSMFHQSVIANDSFQCKSFKQIQVKAFGLNGAKSWIYDLFSYLRRILMGMAI